MASLYEDHARELLQLGPEYHMAKWEHKEATKNKPERLVVSFLIAPLLADGKIAWKYADRKSQKSVDITLAEHDRWILEWETRTGNCHQCAKGHPGQEWTGWHHINGDSYRVCPRCKGTGKSNHEPAQATA